MRFLYLIFAGLIYDHTQSYEPIFIMSSVSFALGAFLFSVTYAEALLRRSRSKKNENLEGHTNPIPVLNDE